MATDWTKYGTPVTNNAPTGSTDWSQYGTPVGAAPEVEQGFFGKLSSRYDALQDQTAARAQNAADRWMAGQQSFPSAALTIAGSGAMGALNPFMALLQPAFENMTPHPSAPANSLNPLDISTRLLKKIDFSDNKAFQRFAMSDAGENLGTNVEDINALVQFTPVGKGTGMISQTTRGAIDGFQAMTSATIPKLQQKVVDDLANTYREVAGTTVRSNRTLLRSEARGKDPAQFLAERNITPTIEDGKIHTFEQSKALRESADPLNDTLDRALVEIQPSLPLTSIDTLRAKALKGLDELQVTETVREALRREINQEWDLRKARYGERIDLRTVNQLKKTDWKATPFDSNKPYQRDINYINGRASKETIEEAVPLDVVDVRELNSHLGDIYDAAKFLDSLEAKAVKGGRLGKFFARTIGAVVGAQGGIAGSILGGLVGDRAAEILQQSTFGGPLKQLILRQIEKENPAVFKQVQEYLKRSGLERQMRPLLPAPKANQSTINQGRAIRQGAFSEGEYIGRDTVISSGGKSQNPAQSLRSSSLQPNQSLLETQSRLPDGTPANSQQLLQSRDPLNSNVPQNQPPSTAYGMLAGINPDEEGNVSFDPLSAALGFGALTAASKLKQSTRLTPKQIAALPELDREDFLAYLKPKLDKLPTPKPGQALIIRSGDGPWTDTDIPTALNRGVNRNTTVSLVDESRLFSTGNPAKDARGERLLDMQVVRQHSRDGQTINEYWRKVSSPGTPSSKQSKATNTSTSNALTGRGDVSVPKTDMSGGFTGDYLYHGTGEVNLDSIAKDGLKPSMRGTLSLSKDEGYSRSFAEGAKFPPQKGSGVMFRVKADFIKDKTVSSNKPRPASDDLNEILTKETIPPEHIEIFKDGEWQPLKPSPSIPKELEGLAAEARKYDTPEDFAANLLFHGTSETRASKILGGEGLVGSKGRVGTTKGGGIRYVSMTPDADAALSYASGRGEQAQIIAVPKPSRILDLGDIRVDGIKTSEGVEFRKKFGAQELYWGGKDVEAYLKSKNVDAIQFMAPDGHIEIRVFGDIKNPLKLPNELISTNPETGYWEINQKALTDFFKKVKGNK